MPFGDSALRSLRLVPGHDLSPHQGAPGPSANLTRQSEYAIALQECTQGALPEDSLCKPTSAISSWTVCVCFGICFQHYVEAGADTIPVLRLPDGGYCGFPFYFLTCRIGSSDPPLSTIVTSPIATPPSSTLSRSSCAKDVMCRPCPFCKGL